MTPLLTVTLPFVFFFVGHGGVLRVRGSPADRPQHLARARADRVDPTSLHFVQKNSVLTSGRADRKGLRTG